MGITFEDKNASMINNEMGRVGATSDNAENLNDVISEIGDELVSSQEQPSQPIVLAQEEDTASGDDSGFDFSRIDNPETSPDEIKELPIWGLPQELQDVAEEVAQGYQCSRDYVVASMMSAASTMLGKKVLGRFVNYRNYGTLWVVIVGDSASGKSQPMSFAFAPIERLERDAFDTYERELREWNITAPDRRGPRPVYKHLLINNASDESVLRELANNGSITWRTDELSTLFGGLGKYSNDSGSIIGNMLSIFTNVDTSITRVSSEPIHMEKPNLNICGSIQPQTLKRVMSKGHYIDAGLFQRFLFVYPKETNIPLFTEFHISEEARCVWDATIGRLARIEELELHETEDAKRLHIDALNRWRCESQSNRQNGALVSLLKKFEYHICRWSVVVASLKNEREISSETIQYSIECMDYLKNCGERALCLVMNDSVPGLTRSIVFKQLQAWYPKLNQSLLGDALETSQQLISKFIRQ